MSLIKIKPESSEVVIKRLDDAIERHIQSVIESLGYVSIERLSLYINSTNIEWKAEAIAAPKWITAIWELVLQIQADVLSGTRPIPSENELIAELPLFTDYLA